MLTFQYTLNVQSTVTVLGIQEIITMGFNPLLQKPFEILVTSVTCFVRLYLLLPLTLRELVSMHQCSSLPLDSVVRILSSKFWKIESDIWADLLIICRWANPTTTIHTKDVTCTLCDGVWNDPATIANCGHTFCRKCLTTAISQCKDCPVCGVQIMYIMPHNREAKRLVELYYQERQVTLEDLQSTCEKFGINFCELQSDNDTLQPQGNGIVFAILYQTILLFIVITVTRGKRQTEELFTSSSPKRKCTVPAQGEI